jgi:hypothetical protein
MENSNLVKIYLLTDDKGLKYVGKTPRSMKQRIAEHRYDKKRCGCSSGLLNLDSVSYEILEEVPNIKSYVKEREGYWIQNTDCVNQQKNYNQEQYKIYQRDYMRRLRLELKLMSEFLKLLEDY